MTHRTVTAVIAIVLTAGAAAVGGRAEAAPTGQRAAPCASPPSFTLTAPEVVSLAAERRITAGAAAARLRLQYRAAELGARVRAAVGPAFGGLWVQADNGDRLAVGVVKGEAASSATELVRQVAADCGVGPGTDIVPVAHSFADLKRSVGKLSADVAGANAGARQSLGVALLTRYNVIELRVPAAGDLTARQQALISAAQTLYGSMLRVRRTSTSFTPSVCSVAIGSCDAPLRGGVAAFLTNAQTSSWCTLGFLARSRTDAVLYVVTAGHCVFDSFAGVDTRKTVWWARQPSTGTFHHIGTPHSSFFDFHGDGALINVENPAGWMAHAWVWVRPPEPTNETYKIAADGSQEDADGSRLCHTGLRSGTVCGTVTGIFVAVRYVDRQGNPYPFTMTSMMQSSACGAAGDSGGPHFNLHIAYGIHSGSSTSGACQSTIQPVQQAENLLNVDLSHES